jgi:hypothetical protein
MMKKAVVDQFLLWVVLFIAFITIFFLVIDYYIILKTKDRCDMLANYGARMKALGKDNAFIISGLNNLKTDQFQTITEDHLDCEDLETTQYQVVFNTAISLKSKFFGIQNIVSTTSTFNETSSIDRRCTLNLILTNEGQL